MGSLRHATWLTSLSLALAACSGSSPPPAPATPPAAAKPDPWPEYSARFIEDYFKADPYFAVQAGRHEFDGQMPDWSAAALAAQAERLKKMRAEAEGFEAATLTADERFEREYLYTVIDREVFWLERARAPFVNPAWYLDRLDPDVYLNREYAPLPKRLAGYIGYARAIPKLAADIRANLRTPMPATFVQRGIDGFGGFADFYRKDVAKVFAAVQDPAAQKDLAAADEAAAKAMDELKKWLLGERRRANNDFALGAPLFQEMVKTTERVDVPIARLLEIGRADLERNTQALKAACAQFLPRATLDACVKKMQSDKPEGGAVDGARAQLTMLRSFVLEKHVVSVPSDEQAQVAEAPPYARANAAYINVPGPYDRNVAYTYNIAPPDPSWNAKERAEYIPGRASLLYTSVHEVWPGHFVQFLHSNRAASKIEALWVGYAFAEGWAHYAEEMMWDEGLGEGNAEQHVGQLCDALLRDVRYLSAIGLHTQGMSVAESDRMFRERAFSDPGNARQQAARGTYDPQYLDYTLGKLMIMKLRADFIAKQANGNGGDPRQYWKDFHDKFLSHGGPPIPLLRQELLGQGGGELF